jgi:hypothetical protein
MDKTSTDPISWHSTNVHCTLSEEVANVIPIKLKIKNYFDVKFDFRGLRSLLLM